MKNPAYPVMLVICTWACAHALIGFLHRDFYKMSDLHSEWCDSTNKYSHLLIENTIFQMSHIDNKVVRDSMEHEYATLKNIQTYWDKKSDSIYSIIDAY